MTEAVLGAILLVAVAIAGFTVATRSRIPSVITTVSLLIVFTGYVSFTPDWDGYEYYFDYQMAPDIFFNWYAGFLSERGYEYDTLHLSFTGMYSVLLAYIASRFVRNAFLPVLLFVLINYLYFATQVRFFLGFFSLSTAIYFYYTGGSRIATFLLTLFAIANHSAMVLFFPLYLVKLINVKSIPKVYAISGLLPAILFKPLAYIVTSYFPTQAKLISYLTETSYSSFTGSMFALLPFLIGGSFLWVFVGKVVRQYYYDPKFKYLYAFALYPVVFAPFLFSFLIIIQRIVLPILFFQILLFLYVNKRKSKEARTINITLLSIFMAIFVAYRYLLPPLILGNNRVAERVIYMIETNALLGQ